MKGEVMRSFEDWYAESKLELNCFQNHLEKQWFVSNVAAGYKAGQESRQTEVDELQYRVDKALFDMNQRKLELRESCDGYKDPVGVCQSEGVEMAIQLLEQALTPQKGGTSQ